MTGPSIVSRSAALLIITVAFALSSTVNGETPQSVDIDSADATLESGVEADSTTADTRELGGDTIVAYYFHGTQRCVTCRKLESYTKEALIAGFENEMTDSILLWRPVNYDEEENDHFIKDYKLFTKAVILSRIRNGEEVEWENLDNIWQLVGDKDEFTDYIQSKTREFMRDEEPDE